MFEMFFQFIFDEGEEPIATEPIFLSIDKNEYSNTNSTPGHYPESNYLDSYNAINQLMASQLEKITITSTANVLCPPTPNASTTSDEDEHHNSTPIIIGNPVQYTSQIPQRRHHPVQ